MARAGQGEHGDCESAPSHSSQWPELAELRLARWQREHVPAVVASSTWMADSPTAPCC